MLPLILKQTLLAKIRRALPLAAARLLLGLRIGLRRRCGGEMPPLGGGAAVAAVACRGGEAMGGMAAVGLRSW